MKRPLLLLTLTILSFTLFAQSSKVQLRMQFDTIVCEDTPKANFTFQMKADSTAQGEFIEISDMNFRFWYDSEKMELASGSIIPANYNEPILASNDIGLDGPLDLFGFDDNMGFVDYTISVSSPSAAAPISNTDWTDFMSVSFTLLNDYLGDCLQIVFSEPVYGTTSNLYTNSYVKIAEVVDGTAQIAEVDISGSEHWNWQDTVMAPLGDCIPLACDTMPGDTMPVDTMTSLNQELLLDVQLTISPNPSSDYLNISSIEILGREEITLSVLNTVGSRILESKFHIFGTLNHTLDVDTLDSGVYLLLVRIGDKYKYLKFVKS